MKPNRFLPLWVSMLMATLAMLLPQSICAAGASSDEINAAIVLDGSIPLTWENDTTYPWSIIDGELRSGNGGIVNTNSEVNFTFNSNFPTTLSFNYDVTGPTNYAYNHNNIKIYVDGEEKVTSYKKTNATYSIRLTKGSHTIKVLNESLSSSTYYSAIYNVNVSEYPGASTNAISEAIVMDGSLPIVWIQDNDFPWQIVDGKLRSGNWGFQNSESKVAFKYSSQYPSTLTLKYDVTGPSSYGYNYNNIHILVDGILKVDTYNKSGSSLTCRLPKGNHIIEVIDQSLTTSYYYSNIYDVKVTEFPGATASEISSSIVKEESIQLNWHQDDDYPWQLIDGKLRSGNWGFQNTESKVSFDYTSDYPTTLTFKYDVTGPSSYYGAQNEACEVEVGGF